MEYSQDHPWVNDPQKKRRIITIAEILFKEKVVKPHIMLLDSGSYTRKIVLRMSGFLKANRFLYGES